MTIHLGTQGWREPPTTQNLYKLFKFFGEDGQLQKLKVREMLAGLRGQSFAKTNPSPTKNTSAGSSSQNFSKKFYETEKVRMVKFMIGTSTVELDIQKTDAFKTFVRIRRKLADSSFRFQNTLDFDARLFLLVVHDLGLKVFGPSSSTDPLVDIPPKWIDSQNQSGSFNLSSLFIWL